MCPTCRGVNVSLLFEAPCPDDLKGPDYRLVRCLGCGLVRIEPAPSDDQLSAFYLDEYFGGLGRADAPGAMARWGGRWFMHGRRRRIERIRSGQTLLDVGCGKGEFLEVMEAGGWQVSGVEPSAKGRAGLSQALRPNVKAHIDEVESGPFDVITLWHVLEHMREPEIDLDKLKRLLKPGGILFVAVPNFASWEARIGGRRWFHLDLPRHLYHFTPDTLSALLQRNGFRVNRINFFSWTYNVFGSWQTLLNLVVPERNYLYKQWKRRTHQRSNLSRRQVFVSCLVSYGAAPVAVLVAIVMSAVSASLRRSGTMEIEASL